MNHSHVLYDSDPHFRIDPITRKITNESSTKTTLIQYDHNSERFTFESPRYVEGHDLSLCNVVEIHYLNVEANTKKVKAGVYSVEDLHVKDDDETTVVCSWLVPYNATQFVGQLQFLVRFSCANEETGKLEYAWNTAPYTNLNVSSGIYNSDSPIDNPVPPFNFVTTINGDILKFFVGTQAQYNELSADDTDGLFAIITDDKTKEEIFAAIDAIISGEIVVPKATKLSPSRIDVNGGVAMGLTLSSGRLGLALEKGKTYIFDVFLDVLGYSHTFVLTVSNSSSISFSTMTRYVEVSGSTLIDGEIWLEYSNGYNGDLIVRARSHDGTFLSTETTALISYIELG